ncbi:MAG: glyoxalase [SAR324 cluster bacterium]|uniref:Glyoxalase n=1 Tax=SAR324 cluster bacterium TaxID=2024889 RepID=A0A2A4SSW8_9DELT|nr:MAG: glyoxalase [SAR324 cluster bacterium]
MRYAHTNIAARDWKRLSDFYINVFSCTVKPPLRKLSGDWLDQATGLSNAELEGVHLLLPGHGDNGPTLEIFTYKNTHESDPIMANHTGFAHIAFEVDDVDQTLRHALKNGGALLGKVTEKQVEGVGLLKFLYFRDPEGNIIEIQSWEK